MEEWIGDVIVKERKETKERRPYNIPLRGLNTPPRGHMVMR
jgi:hypothetical protein